MIHIIVYSTTNTAAKMYKKNLKTFSKELRRKMVMAGTLGIHLNGCGRAGPTHCVVCAYGGL